jgi:hypothetical protein
MPSPPAGIESLEGFFDAQPLRAAGHIWLVLLPRAQRIARSETPGG